MPDLLLELFSEEIPARMQSKARDDLRRLVTEGLVEAGLTYAHAGSFSTPRRLALVVEGLTAESRPVREERKGPRVDAPAAAVEGFLRSTGLSREQLEVRADKKAEVFFAVIEKPGRPAAAIVAEVVEGVIRNFPWPKSMRWGSGSLRWVRPLRSILCLLHDEGGAQVVPFQIEGVAAGDSTEGHRFMAPGRFSVANAEDYRAKLTRAFVRLDAAEREAAILHDAESAAFAQGLELVPDPGLLTEVAGLVEWPVVILGRIAPDFLHLPPEVLQTSMREHQKFFSLKNPATGRIEGFVTVANRETADHGATILKGNQKVLSARLSDARFFWENDLRVAKAGMADWAEGLRAVTFHNRLGSQADRIDRIAALAREIAPRVEADPDQAERAARIAKLDLRSAMVGEFPELQGTMGRYYALEAGEPGPVADAARDHYSPLGPSDDVPSEPVSVAVALADKLDTLTGFWAIDEKPTGSKDPFALRRAALGVIRLVLGNGVRIEISPLLTQAFRYSLAFSGSEFGNHADAREMSFLDDSYKHVISGLLPKGAALAFVFSSQQYRDLEQDVAGGFSWKEGQPGAEDRLKRFIDRVMNTEYLAMELRDGFGSQAFAKQYPGSIAELAGLQSIFDEELAPIKADLLSFLHDRLKVFLKDQGIRHDVIDACLAMPGNDDLTLLVKRAEALSATLKTEDGANLLQGFKRANNILTQAEQKDGVEYSFGPDPKLAEGPEEAALFAALDRAEATIAPAMAQEDFAAAMAAMAALRGPIDAFFTAVQVNADNPVVRRNRLNLLHRIRATCAQVADLTRIEG